MRPPTPLGGDVSPGIIEVVDVDDERDLILICYVSAAATKLEKPDIVALLASARTRNAALGISGMLLYVEPTFFQILEGEAAAVRDLYATIAGDPRHTAILKLIEEPIERRSFADWTMGYADVSRSELATIPGLNDFFLGASSLFELEPGRAQMLLAAFREGRWRRRLSG